MVEADYNTALYAGFAFLVVFYLLFSIWRQRG